MQSLLLELFNQSNFNIINPLFMEEQSGFLASSAETHKANYFLVVFENEDNFIFNEVSERLHQYYGAMKTMDQGYDRRMDKNLTIIIALKRASLTINETLNRTIFELEENPYQFRSLVLVYGDDEVAQISQLRKEQDLLPFLYSLINNRDSFYEFKKYPFELTAYSLTTRLFIKLPFINYKGLNEELSLLSNDIEERLDTLNLNDTRESALSLQMSLSSPTISPEQKSLLLSQWLGVIDNE
ncbi:ABC-three component system middle component 1 [Paenibacillus sp. FSL M7-0896]|uniref:ABC-three component system middle component 1 n=1 Tax=Paenibacillus sp. FSL M7-0896 TaxID=2921610 RepID=UPI0030D70618